MFNFEDVLSFIAPKTQSALLIGMYVTGGKYLQ